MKVQFWNGDNPHPSDGVRNMGLGYDRDAPHWTEQLGIYSPARPGGGGGSSFGGGSSSSSNGGNSGIMNFLGEKIVHHATGQIFDLRENGLFVPYTNTLVTYQDVLDGRYLRGIDGTSDGGEGFEWTTADTVDTALGFVPVVGSLNDIRNGINSGSGWAVAAGVGFLVLDVATLGSSSLIKGGIKAGSKGLFKTVVKVFLKEQNIQRKS